MLIMPSTDVNFQAYAENIVADFFGKSVPLSDGIVKVAKEHEFTPEEVKRLLEKTNTAASIHLLKTASDKKQSFTLANLDLVLSQTHPDDDIRIEKTASVYQGLPDTRTKHTPFKKEASANDCKCASEKTEIDGMKALFVTRQEIDSRVMEKMALEGKINSHLEKLATNFNTWNGPDFSKFASEATALYGKSARPALDGLAKYLNIPLKKIASINGFVDDRSENLKSMGEIVKGLSRLVKLSSEIDALASIRDNIWKGLKLASKI